MKMRQALPADANIAARLIASTLGVFELAVFGLGDEQRMIASIEAFTSRKGNRFSCDCANLVEIDREVAGLLLCFPSAKLVSLTLNMVRAMPSIYGLRDTLRALGRALPAAFYRETKPGELYIAHLATAPAFRNRGVGRFMLAEVESRARQEGLGRLSLMVEADNQAALTLYESSGFKIEKKYNLRYLNKGLHSCGLNRMVKNLT